MSEFDVVVIGGGLGGLMCAARLAKDGMRVKVLERASHVGGRARSPHVGAFPVNLGAHALYADGPAERMLATLGVEVRGFKPNARDAWLSDADGVFASPTSIMSLATSRMFSFGERVSLMRFFALALGSPLRGASTTAWLDSLALGARARRFVDAMVRVATYSNMPDALSAEVAARQLARAIGPRAAGVVYVDDGWQSLVDGVASVAKNAGVAIETDAHVAHVSEVRAKHVVVALPRAAAAHVTSALDDVPPIRAACLDMTIDGPLSKRLVFGLEEPHYFSVHSRDTEAAPLRAHALRYLAPGEKGADYKDSLEAWLARVVPDLGARVMAKRFLPEMEVAGALPARDAVPSLERVSFVGDWTSATYQLLDAVAESVENAIGRIARERTRAAA